MVNENKQDVKYTMILRPAKKDSEEMKVTHCDLKRQEIYG